MNFLHLFTLIPSLCLSVNNLSNSNTNDAPTKSAELADKTVRATGSHDIIDGGVYVIKPCIGTNKVLDIPNYNYTAGVKPALYDEHWLANQRFVIEKSYKKDSSSYYYRIRPLESMDLYLSIKKINGEKRVVLKRDTDYSKTNLKVDRFAFTYESSSDAYLISTYESDNSEKLHVVNNNAINGSEICSGYAPGGYSGSYRWKLLLTDQLNDNINRDFSINAGESVLFNVKQTVATKYVFMLKHKNYGNARISLMSDDFSSTVRSYNSTGGNGYSTSFTQSITTDNYRLVIENNGSSVFNGTVCTYPYQRAAFATMFDYDHNNMDSVSQIVKNYKAITDCGFYPSVKVNMGNWGCFSNTVSGKTFANSQMFFAIGHGNPGGICFYDGIDENGGWIDLNNMPSFSGTTFTYWGSCQGDTLSTNHNGMGVTSSLARRAVEKGADFSVGHRGDVLSEVARDIPRRFFNKYKSNKSVRTCMANVLKDLSNDIRISICSMFASGTLNATLYVNNRVTGSIERYDLVSNTSIQDNVPSKKTLVSKNKEYFEHNDTKYCILDGTYTNIEYKTDLKSMDSIGNIRKTLQRRRAKYKVDVILKEGKEIRYLTYNKEKVSFFDSFTGEEYHLNLDSTSKSIA